MSIQPVKAYAEERLKQLRRGQVPAESGIQELEMIIVLCDGLIKQEQMIQAALGINHEITGLAT